MKSRLQAQGLAALGGAAIAGTPYRGVIDCMARTAREATRDRLTAASLARMTAPDADPAEFPANARFALATLPALTTRPDQIKPLRQTILNLAVRPTDTAAIRVMCSLLVHDIGNPFYPSPKHAFLGIGVFFAVPSLHPSGDPLLSATIAGFFL